MGNEYQGFTRNEYDSRRMPIIAKINVIVFTCPNFLRNHPIKWKQSIKDQRGGYFNKLPERKRKGASPAKHWMPIASPSSNLIQRKEEQPWAPAKSSRNQKRNCHIRAMQAPNEMQLKKNSRTFTSLNRLKTFWNASGSWWYSICKHILTSKKWLICWNPLINSYVHFYLDFRNAEGIYNQNQRYQDKTY